MKTLIIALLILWLLAGILPIDAYALGEAGAQFLEIGVGSKACAMGEAFVGVADDPTSVYWNIAGLDQINSFTAIAMQNFWLLDMGYQYLAAALPSYYGTFGIAIAYSSSGKIPKYENFQQIGEYTAYDAAGTIAYANNIRQAISYGMSIKFIKQRIEAEDASSFGFDVGLLYKPLSFDKMKIGLVLQNLGKGVKFVEETDPLPLKIRAGLSYRISSLTLAGDLSKSHYGKSVLGLGAEYSFREILHLRAGYNSMNPLSLGFGINCGKIAFEYAYVPYRDIDNTHRISVKLGI